MATLTRPIPVYRQLYEDLRNQIMCGELQIGARLHPVREAAIKHGLAPATVQRAYEELSREGLIETRLGNQGGSFVSACPPRSSEDDYRTGRDVGKIYGGSRRAEILAAGTVPATEDVARMLGLKPGDPVVRRERVVYPKSDDADVKPVSASVSYHDAALLGHAPRLVEMARIPQGTPTYIQETTGYVGTEVVEMPSARTATEEEARRLQLPAGSPVMVVRNTFTTDDGTVIEYGVCVIPPGVERVYRSRIERSST